MNYNTCNTSPLIVSIFVNRKLNMNSKAWAMEVCMFLWSQTQLYPRSCTAQNHSMCSQSCPQVNKHTWKSVQREWVEAKGGPWVLCLARGSVLFLKWGLSLVRNTMWTTNVSLIGLKWNSPDVFNRQYSLKKHIPIYPFPFVSSFPCSVLHSSTFLTSFCSLPYFRNYFLDWDFIIIIIWGYAILFYSVHHSTNILRVD